MPFYFEESNMNKCHLVKLSFAALLATAPVVFAQAPAQVAGRLNGLFFLPHPEWKKRRLAKKFFEKLKETTKAGKDCFGTIIESTLDYHDFTYADRKIWWSIH